MKLSSLSDQCLLGFRLGSNHPFTIELAAISVEISRRSSSPSKSRKRMPHLDVTVPAGDATLWHVHDDTGS